MVPAMARINHRFAPQLVLSLSFLLLTGCAARALLRTAEAAPPGASAFDATHSALGERGRRAWAAHLWASSNAEHQPTCAPRRFAPQGEPKGVVVIFHGFSACPDQFDLIGPRVAADGFEVLVPLLPGHGRVLPPKPTSQKLVDDVSTLPTRRDWQRYRDFAEDWADVLTEARGSRVLVGYSLGGALAMQAVAARSNSMDRALVIAPFLSISNTFARMILGMAEGVDALLTTNPFDPMEHHWGPSCEDERRLGRGGYCSFQVNHVAAAQLLGNEARHALGRASRVPALQLVVIDEDDAVHTPLAVDMLRLAATRSPDARWCSYARGMPHSFFSPKDRPTDPKPWLPAFTDAAVALITQGTLFSPGTCPGGGK